MGKYALIGSTVATVVRAPVEGPTRSPICALMSPAMPSMGETMCVKLRLRLAWSTAARADATWASAASRAWTASSSSSWLIALSRARGVKRATSRSALPSCAWACASWPSACASAAAKGLGSISKSGSPLRTTEPSM